jgi:hypothetical protein
MGSKRAEDIEGILFYKTCNADGSIWRGAKIIYWLGRAALALSLSSVKV